MKSWKFIIDLVCIFPFDILYFFVGYNAFLRVNKCLKVWRLREFFNLAETHTNYPNLLRVANLILIIIIIIHWNCCLYFALSRYLGFGSDGWTYPDVTDRSQASSRTWQSISKFSRKCDPIKYVPNISEFQSPISFTKD